VILLLAPPLLWLLAGGALAAGAPGWLLGSLVLPAVLWAPGLGWARWLQARGAAQAAPLQLGIDAAWISIGLVVLSGSVVRELGLAHGWLLGLSVAWGLPGLALAWRCGAAPLPRLDRRVTAALVAVVLTVALVARAHAPALVRPVDAYWWHSAPDQESWQRTTVDAPGFSEIGWPEAGAMKAELAAGEHPIVATSRGPLLVAARAAVGTSVALSQNGAELGHAVVERDPMEDEEEGPVPRYLSRGVAAAYGVLSPGPATITLDDAATVYLVPSQDAVWALDELGELRFVHYYQCLNIVENQRWAASTLEDLRATVNQPPLWAYVLAVPTALISPDMKGAGLLFLWVLLLCGASGVRLLQVAGPDAAWPAWLLPALATGVHGRLMIEPGSFNFPDSLYTGAIIAGLAALLAGAPARTTLLAIAASLLRYPGAVLIAGSTLLWSLLQGRLRGLLRPALTIGIVGIGLAALVAVAGLLSGQLAEWWKILWFETFQEHWHGEGDPRVLLGRTPWFYWSWVVYAGGAPLLAVVTARGRSLHILLTAAAYSLLLCTIDHSPTHYFLPLVHLSAVALAAGAGTMPVRPVRWVVLGLGLVGLTWSAVLGHAL
jgi:hypothetical protein